MKNKRILSVLLVLVMALSTSIPVVAVASPVYENPHIGCCADVKLDVDFTPYSLPASFRIISTYIHYQYCEYELIQPHNPINAICGAFLSHNLERRPVVTNEVHSPACGRGGICSITINTRYWCTRALCSYSRPYSVVTHQVMCM